MIKSIIKEVIIILLLLVAVVLAMGVLFYDYIPSNKTVPTVEKYATAASVAQELQEKITESETILVTYQVTSDDLNNLVKTNNYEPGKANPFSTFEEPVQEPNGDDNNTTTNPGNVNTSKSPNGNTSSGNKTNNNNTFYPNTGTK